jgi:hypothetical protein
MSSASAQGSTVWQGYVAAIASLAQAMLFLLAILTVAISQIAAQIAFDERGAVSESPLRTAAPAATPRDPERTAAPSRPAEASVPSESAVPVAPARVDTPQAPAGAAERIAAQFRIVFHDDVVTIADPQKRALASQFGPVSRTSPGRWLVRARVPLDEPALKRAAYLRLLAARSALIAAGSNSTDIDVELLDGGDAEALARSMPVTIERTASPAQSPDRQTP